MSEMLSCIKVKTRTPHICFGCGRRFEKGTNMWREGIADAGTVWTCYLCKTCFDVARNLEYGDEFGFSDLREETLEIEREVEKAIEGRSKNKNE